MHLVVLTHALPWHRPGGLERATATMIDLMLARGHWVTVITTPADYPKLKAGSFLEILDPSWSDPNKIEIINSYSSFFPHWVAEEKPENILKRHSSSFKGRCFVAITDAPTGRPSPAFWKASFHLAKYVAGKYGTLWEMGYPIILAVDLAPMRLRGVPFIQQVHGTLFSETTLHKGFENFRKEFPVWEGVKRYKTRILASPLFKPMLRRAAHLITDSEFTTSELKRLARDTAEKTTTLPLALSPDWANELRRARYLWEKNPKTEKTDAFSESNPMRLFTVGRASRIKGHEVVAQAVAKLLKSGRKNILWEIAGPQSNNPSDWELKNWPTELPKPGEAEKEKNSDHNTVCRWLGKIPTEELAAALGRAHYLLNMEYNQPAFGLVALEAMCAGAVPVLSKRGALPEVLGDSGAGYLLEAGDVDGLTELLIKLYDAGPAHAAELSRKAQARSYDFSAERYAQKLEAILLREQNRLNAKNK